MPDAENFKPFDPTLEATSETIIANSVNIDQADRLNYESTDVTVEQTNANDAHTEIESTPVTSDANEDIGLSYKRLDGTVEKATSSKEAIARCPYLSKLPMEQANVLLELSRAGKAMMAQEKSNIESPSAKTKERTTDTTTNESEPKSTKQTEINKPTLQLEVAVPDIRPPESILDISHSMAIRSKETQLQDAIDLATKHLVIKTKPNSGSHNPEHQVVVAAPIKKLRPIKPNTSVIKSSTKQNHTHQSKLSRLSTTPSFENVVINHNHQPNDATVEKVVIEKLTPHVEISPTVVTEVLATAKNTAGFMKSELTPITPTTEQDYADEAVATFNQLMELVLVDNTEVMPATATSETALIETNISESLEANDVPTVNDFEEFVMTQAITETVADMETIIQLAEQQEVEVSLLQLISLIRSAPAANKSTMLAISRLTETFRTTNNNPESKSKYEDLTPDMTKNILALLRLIGYENPALTLMEFVARHDLELLISAMDYLEQLTNPDNRHEFLSNRILSPIYGTFINPLAVSLGKTVMKLSNLKFSNLLTSI